MTKPVSLLPDSRGLDSGSFADLDLYTLKSYVDAQIAAAGLGGFANLALTGTLTLNGDAVTATRARRAELLRPTVALRETIERGATAIGNQAGVLTSGTRLMAGLPLFKGDPVGTLGFLSGTTAAVSPTHWWLELWDSARGLVMVSADQTTTAIPASTVMTAAVAKSGGGSYTVPADGLYYLGLVVVAGTVPTLFGTSGISSTVLGQAPKLAGNSDAGLSAPPGFPTTAAAIAPNGVWAYGFSA